MRRDERESSLVFIRLTGLVRATMPRDLRSLGATPSASAGRRSANGIVPPIQAGGTRNNGGPSDRGVSQCKEETPLVRPGWTSSNPHDCVTADLEYIETRPPSVSSSLQISVSRLFSLELTLSSFPLHFYARTMASIATFSSSGTLSQASISDSSRGSSAISQREMLPLSLLGSFMLP